MLDKFARLLGIRPDQAEDALHSERAARHVVSRRSFFGAAGALAAGTAFSFAPPAKAEEPNFLLDVPPAPRGFALGTGCIWVASGIDFYPNAGTTGIANPEYWKASARAYEDYAEFRKRGR